LERQKEREHREAQQRRREVIEDRRDQRREAQRRADQRDQRRALERAYEQGYEDSQARSGPQIVIVERERERRNRGFFGIWLAGLATLDRAMDFGRRNDRDRD
jgi:hypothetical protein